MKKINFILLSLLAIFMMVGCRSDEPKPKTVKELSVTPKNETLDEAVKRLHALMETPIPAEPYLIEARDNAIFSVQTYVQNKGWEKRRKGGLDWDIILNILEVVATIVLVYVVYLKFVLKKDI
jgi:hypothetical protein